MNILVWGFQILLVQQAIHHKSFFRDMIFLYLMALGLTIVVGCVALFLTCIFRVIESKMRDYNRFENEANIENFDQVQVVQDRQNFENGT
jgi:hypothetical protein